jgi:hypothetical protein
MRRSLIGVLLAALLLPVATADASPKSSERAWVSLGDSFISGEGGRWRGNTNNTFLNTDTDRAYAGFGWNGRQYDQKRVYIDGSWDNGCHRSDVSEIITAAAGSGATAVNLACSGAETKNLISAKINGFEAFKGEGSQVDRLGQVARDKNVKLVVVSIGGNDLRFSDIIEDCIKGNLGAPFYTWSCADTQGPEVTKRMPGTVSNVRRVLDSVKDTMKAAGYDRDDYRLVLQSYPSPVPRAVDQSVTAAESNITYGCPFNGPDLTWARDTLTPQLATNLRAVAETEDAEFLDVQDLFDGHEVCSKSIALTNDNSTPDSGIAWMRWLDTGLYSGAAFKQESYHPNAVGQKALGRCLRLLADSPEGRDWKCTAGANVDPNGARLTQLKGKAIKIAPQKPGYVDQGEHPIDDDAPLTQADIDHAAEAKGQQTATKDTPEVEATPPVATTR